ncbi:NADH-ubiquinone oxidoreductase-F iron-sulfur binding region domain-containing protein [Nocardioides panaciterrulae]|uniref:NADH:ubiquinone oxidoreductase subunit F (NADH-binding) n=1 Tax=Nocardioides panaciterrulae TaxID=661492 RepID=A0A7Y9J9L2_9ACTN|nr:NADH-ubiquinone oxidoreductase-F iron-sulfur binding region domain-containing protein [Nocardioides panaciterrulae]NYD40732.1 NADH:ubiquinone oxidoreductase subunit F (NADH-binding) [Nocardioides panaciterrulae]
MSTMATPDTHRLLAATPAEHPPRLTLEQLLGLVEDAGLTGRGGAGFPTAIKVRSVAEGRRRPVLVGNAMEGEPLSKKDAVLLTRVPHLVVEGLAVVGRAIGARRLVLAIGPDVHPAAAEEAARGRGVEVARLDGGFVAGQESALVNQLGGRPAVPSDPLVRVTTRGLDGRPTLVLNAETLAQVALLARHGADWFRRVGTEEDPGTSLFSISGAVAHPGVVEAGRGTPLSRVLAPAEPDAPVAVLVGGYHGAWVPGWALDTPLTGSALKEYGATVGAGVLHVLGPNTCPIRVAADIAAYLAGESAQQCGPCLNGLPRMAEGLRRLARRAPDPGLPAEIDRMRLLVTGRGACAHPDGTARMVASTMRVFAPHVDRHLAGHCGLEGHR